MNTSNITPTQIKRLHVLLHQTGNTKNKANMVFGFTEGRTEHSSEMTDEEAAELIDHLVKSGPSKKMDAANKMRRKIISQAYEMGWAKPGNWKGAIAAIDKFCTSEKGKFKKRLQEHSYSELVQLVTQFQQLYKKHLNAF